MPFCSAAIPLFVLAGPQHGDDFESHIQLPSALAYSEETTLQGIFGLKWTRSAHAFQEFYVNQIRERMFQGNL